MVIFIYLKKNTPEKEEEHNPIARAVKVVANKQIEQSKQLHLLCCSVQTLAARVFEFQSDFQLTASKWSNLCLVIQLIHFPRLDYPNRGFTKREC